MFKCEDYAMQKHKVHKEPTQEPLSKDKDNMFQIDLSELIQNEKMSRQDYMNTLKVLKINHIKNILTIVNVCVQSDKGFEIILFKLHEAYTYIIETNLIESSIVNIFTGINQKLHEMIIQMAVKERSVPENWADIIN